MADAIHTVAVFNASDDTVDMLTVLLSNRGYRAVFGHADQVKSGELDFIAFLTAPQPSAIIWDISPPYDVTGTSCNSYARFSHCSAA